MHRTARVFALGCALAVGALLAAPAGTAAPATSTPAAPATSTPAAPATPDDVTLTRDPAGTTAVAVGTPSAVLIPLVIGSEGPGSDAATLAVTAPAGWTGQVGGEAACTTTTTGLACAVPRLLGSTVQTESIGLTLHPVAGTTPGSSATIALHLAPVAAPDPDPANNDVTVPVRIVAATTVAARTTQTATTVPTGGTVALVLVLTDTGSAPLSGADVDLTVRIGSGAIGAESLTASQGTAAFALAVDDDVLWSPGRIGPGASATLTVAISHLPAAARFRLVGNVTSDNAPTAYFVGADVSVVSAASVTPPPAALPNTGVGVGGELGLAGALFSAGVSLVVAARRRTT